LPDSQHLVCVPSVESLSFEWIVNLIDGGPPTRRWFTAAAARRQTFTAPRTGWGLLCGTCAEGDPAYDRLPN
jgi:hypothetical protein